MPPSARPNANATSPDATTRRRTACSRRRRRDGRAAQSRPCSPGAPVRDRSLPRRNRTQRELAPTSAADRRRAGARLPASPCCRAANPSSQERQEFARVDADLLDHAAQQRRRSQHLPLAPRAAGQLDRVQPRRARPHGHAPAASSCASSSSRPKRRSCTGTRRSIRAAPTSIRSSSIAIRRSSSCRARSPSR